MNFTFLFTQCWFYLQTINFFYNCIYSPRQTLAGTQFLVFYWPRVHPPSSHTASYLSHLQQRQNMKQFQENFIGWLFLIRSYKAFLQLFLWRNFFEIKKTNYFFEKTIAAIPYIPSNCKIENVAQNVFIYTCMQPWWQRNSIWISGWTALSNRECG